jgi:hypothetical protein
VLPPVDLFTTVIGGKSQARELTSPEAVGKTKGPVSFEIGPFKIVPSILPSRNAVETACIALMAKLRELSLRCRLTGSDDEAGAAVLRPAVFGMVGTYGNFRAVTNGRKPFSADPESDHVILSCLCALRA